MLLILGSSVALGWGVDSEDTFTNVLNKKLKKIKKIGYLLMEELEIIIQRGT